MGGSASAAAARSGYWKDHTHVEAELRRWMAQRGVAGRMPTQAELRASGAAALCVAVSSLGGIQGFAARLGRARGCMPCVSPSVVALCRLTYIPQVTDVRLCHQSALLVALCMNPFCSSVVSSVDGSVPE